MTRPIDRLLSVMDSLRDPDGGCPWDLAQDFRSIAPHTLEEAYEVVDAIERGDDAALLDELGDLLFQVVFLARLGQEAGRFDFEAVATGIAEKLERRHPHVFGDAVIDDAFAQSASWESLKATEREWRGLTGSLAGLPTGLPALTYAMKLGKRAARVGFDWPDTEGVLAKVDEERGEFLEAMQSGSSGRMEEELGDLLFALVNLARHLGLDPERGLRGTNRRFEQRFATVESTVDATGRRMSDLDLQELESLWQSAKRWASAAG